MAIQALGIIGRRANERRIDYLSTKPDLYKSSLKLSVSRLLNEALHHRAIHHPYLKGLAAGEFKNMDIVLKDFATQYGYYSSWFPRYLTASISKLDQIQHRNKLLHNLAEESGHLREDDLVEIRKLGIKDEWVQGVPHPELFRRFQNAMHVEKNNKPGVEVEIWRESFLSLVTSGSSISAVGAIGLGTESIVKFVYKYLIKAITKYTDLTLEEYVFFPLHTEVDDEHGLILIDIASEIAGENELAERELRKGMLKALNLRAAFWDDMLLRAKRLDKRVKH